MHSYRITFVLLILTISAAAASKPHVMSLGKPMPVKLLLGPAEEKTLTINVRPLYLDTKLKEYTAGGADGCWWIAPREGLPRSSYPTSIRPTPT